MRGRSITKIQRCAVHFVAEAEKENLNPTFVTRAHGDPSTELVSWVLSLRGRVHTGCVQNAHVDIRALILVVTKWTASVDLRTPRFAGASLILLDQDASDPLNSSLLS